MDDAARSSTAERDRPYAHELEEERAGWYELAELVRSLTPDECLVPGYYHDPDWTVRDAVAHLGTWLAKAAGELERLIAGTYEGHDIDIDGLNATILAGMQGQPWDVAWVQANAGRSRLTRCGRACRGRGTACPPTSAGTPRTRRRGFAPRRCGTPTGCAGR